MRILWLGTDLLLPLDKGGKLRTWHLMRQLARRHEITFLSFADPDQPQADRDGMREVCSRLATVPRRPVGKGTARFYLAVAWRLCDFAPYAVASYRSREYRRTLAALLAAGRFDLIVCDFLVPAVNLPAALPCPLVLFTHNVEAEIWRRHAETTGHPVRRLLYRSQWKRMLRFERRTLARADHVLAVSDTDRDTLLRLYAPPARVPITVVPTGVDTAFFAPAADTVELAGRLVFTGSMDWLPNEDAAIFFCREILPRVRHSAPGATVSLVGRAPTPRVQRLAREDGVEVTGTVEDVRPHLERAQVCIVPLRIGGGTRLKIFEAMAMGKAVVSTSVGAEGLPVVPGRHLAVADDAAAFAEAVVALLENAERRRDLAREARSLVTAQYDWSVVAGELDEALGRTSRSAHGTPEPGRSPLDARSEAAAAGLYTRRDGA